MTYPKNAVCKDHISWCHKQSSCAVTVDKGDSIQTNIDFRLFAKGIENTNDLELSSSNDAVVRALSIFSASIVRILAQLQGGKSVFREAARTKITNFVDRVGTQGKGLHLKCGFGGHTARDLVQIGITARVGNCKLRWGHGGTRRRNSRGRSQCVLCCCGVTAKGR